MSSCRTAVWTVIRADKRSVWRDSNESRGFVPLLAHKHYIEYFSNFSYRFRGKLYRDNYRYRIIAQPYNEFTLFKCPPQSPDLNPIEHLWDVVEREIRIMDVQPTNLQQLRDAIMSIWTKISEECFNTLLNLCHEELRHFWRQKGAQPSTSKVYLIKWPVSVYF